MPNRKEKFYDLDVNQLLKDPDVVKEVVRQCWGDGDMKGTLKYLKILARDFGIKDDELTLKDEAPEFRIMHLMQKTGVRLSF